MTFTQPAVIKVARAVADAWSRATRDTDAAVGLGVVAALLLLGRHEPKDLDPKRKILTASDEEIAQMLEGVWCLFTIIRPELAFRCGPFAEWLNEEPRSAAHVAAAAAVARAAAKAGLFDSPLGRPSAQKVDVLGHCNLLLRNDEAPSGSRGQFYTPAPVAEAMASMALAVPEREKSVCESYAGTGGLLRAAAVELRKAGKDPQDFWWYGCDVDPVVAAALAVNVHLWELGPRVLIGCANVLAEPDWRVRAAEEQRTAVVVLETLETGVTLLAAADSASKSPDRGEA